MLKKLLSDSAIYGIAPQIPQIANIFVLPIITKDLTQLDYGVAGVIYSYLAALSALQMLGLQVPLSNGFFHHTKQYKWLWRQIHGFVSLWSLFFSLIVAGVLYFVIPDEAIEHRWTIIIIHMLPFALFNVTILYGRTYYQISRNPKPIGIQMVVIGIISILINLYLISYEKMGYMGWFWSRFIGSVLSFLFFFYPMYIQKNFIPIFNFKWRLIKEKLKIAIPIIPHVYGSYILSSSDRMVMDVLQVNVKRIGLYNLAGNFGNYFDAFSTGSGMAIQPVIYEYYRRFDKAKSFILNRKMIFLWQSALLIFSFTVCLWFKEIFYILINNEDLQSAYSLAIIIIMGYNYRPMFSAVATKLYYFEKSSAVWRISMGAGVLNIVLNIIFIPIYGIAAAAVTTFIAFMFMGIIGYYLKEYKELEDLNYYTYHWLVAICLVTALVFYLKDIHVLYKMTITLILMAGTLAWALKNKKFLQSFNVQA